MTDTTYMCEWCYKRYLVSDIPEALDDSHPGSPEEWKCPNCGSPQSMDPFKPRRYWKWHEVSQKPLPKPPRPTRQNQPNPVHRNRPTAAS